MSDLEVSFLCGFVGFLMFLMLGLGFWVGKVWERYQTMVKKLRDDLRKTEAKPLHIYKEEP